MTAFSLEKQSFVSIVWIVGHGNPCSCFFTYFFKYTKFFLAAGAHRQISVIKILTEEIGTGI